MILWKRSAPAVSQIFILTYWPLTCRCLIVKSIPIVVTCYALNTSLHRRDQMLVLPTPMFPTSRTFIYRGL